jgi:hypothetical protein
LAKCGFYFHLPFFHFIVACEEIINVFIRSIGSGGHGLNHPISKFRMQIDLSQFRIDRFVGLNLFVVLMNEIEGLIRELDRLFFVIKMEQDVLKFLTPVQISPVTVLIFVSLVQLDVFKDPSLLVLGD